MSHHLVEVPVTPERTDEADLVGARLWSLGAAGVEEHADRLVAAFTDPTAARAAATEFGVAPPTEVDDDVGLDEWQAHATLVTAHPFVIHPPWIDPPAGELVLSIDPGHAFGSGSHPSTRLALQALAGVVRPGDRVLDIGCGSGVLAVAAARLGADATATDIDPESRRATTANAEVNGVAQHVAVTETIPSGEVFDVVVVNMTIDLHESIAASTRRHVGDQGRLIVSGLLKGSQEHRAADAYGRHPSTRLIEGEWACLVMSG